MPIETAARIAPEVANLNRIAADAPDLMETLSQYMEQDGYAILTDVLDAATCQTLVDEVDRVEREYKIPFGANEFEGFQTRRIFNLIAWGPTFRELVITEPVLGAVESVLGEGFLLSGTTSMHIGPGETPQLLHPDDGMVNLPRPHPATMVTTLWALTDFTEENGATRFVPGSHERSGMVPSAEEQDEVIAATMEAGSVLLINASVWHGGGPNSTENFERYGLSVQYVAGWCRQQQNLMLGTPREVVLGYPRRLQELIGYSLFKNVMGHVNRKHPLSLLGEEVAPEMVWDKMREPDEAP